MRNEYDFTNAIKNPYIKRCKTVVTIRLDTVVVEYFGSVTFGGGGGGSGAG